MPLLLRIHQAGVTGKGSTFLGSAFINSQHSLSNLRTIFTKANKPISMQSGTHGLQTSQFLGSGDQWLQSHSVEIGKEYPFRSDIQELYHQFCPNLAGTYYGNCRLRHSSTTARSQSSHEAAGRFGGWQKHHSRAIGSNSFYINFGK